MTTSSSRPVGGAGLEEHDVLVAFTEYNRNVIRLLPPLIMRPEHVDKLVDSLEFISAFALLSGMTPEEKIRCKQA